MRPRIYTRSGDTGDTSLACGQRIPKDDLRIEAYGTLDELSSVLGVVSALLQRELTQTVSEQMQTDWRQQITLVEWMQDKLFTLSSMIATANLPAGNMPTLQQEDVDYLENQIDVMESELPELRNFILPGGSELASFIHLARTVCRRAERMCSTLDRTTALHPVILPFLNRLSDELFVFARWVSHRQAQPEKIWMGRSRPADSGRNRIKLQEGLAQKLSDGTTQLDLFPTT